MQCPSCHGAGIVPRPSFLWNPFYPHVCRDCNGTGVADCCSGERACEVEEKRDE
jgi:DnaJ-class molecular chaperone